MAAKKLLRLVNGKLQEVLGIVVSSGAPNDGDIPALGTDGKLDVSVLPTGVGPDVAVLEASENIGAGEYVNIFDDTGTPKIRKADNSNGRDAHGFLKTAVTTGNNGTVYFEGPNDNLTGLTIGARYYLGTAGAATATPPVAPAASISQFLGIAVNATTINTDIDDCVGLTS